MTMNRVFMLKDFSGADDHKIVIGEQELVQFATDITGEPAGTFDYACMLLQNTQSYLVIETKASAFPCGIYYKQ